jgi:two-component system cell cycle response regulator
MPQDPLVTVKFPKVVAIQAPPPVDALSSESEPVLASPKHSSLAPAWYEDDRPTQRGIHAAVAAPVVAPSRRPLLTILEGLNAGQVFTLDRDETFLGRGRDAHVHLDDIGISRKHARIVRVEGRRHVLEDLGSTNGVFVNGSKIDRASLASGDRVQIGPTLVLGFGYIAADEEALARKLFEGSTRDAMTRLFNRKYASERLVAEVAYAHRHGTLLSLVLFDLDHFKRINDDFGHLAGDVVLRIVAAQVQKSVRAEDVVARYGGEEFVVLVRGIEHEGVSLLANRVRTCVERLAIPWESRTLRVTVSIGVASLSQCEPKAAVEALVALADARLYQAKTRGRNRVC